MSSYMKDENDFWNLLLDSSSLIVIFFFAITSETRGRIIDGAFSKHEPCFFVCILIWSTSIEWMRALSQQQNVPLFVGTRKYSLSVSPIYSGSLTIGMRFTALFPSTKSSTSNIIIDFNTNDLTIDWTWEVFECYRIHRKCLPTVTKENAESNNTITYTKMMATKDGRFKKYEETYISTLSEFFSLAFCLLCIAEILSFCFVVCVCEFYSHSKVDSMHNTQHFLYT